LTSGSSHLILALAVSPHQYLKGVSIMERGTLPDLGRYLPLANQALAKLLTHLKKEEPGPVGGFFSLTDQEGQPLLVFQVGMPPVEKLKGRFERALEKPLRAALSGHTTSRATRDEERDRWGGALYGGITDVHAGFSGLPEDYDELLVADVLVSAGDLSPLEAFKQLSDNETFSTLRYVFDWAK
jgi:hypothetical protein